jgi:DNA polymerase-4/DNA polymerase V
VQTQPISIHSWPRAILHVDADAFFASCEQAVHPELRGKPVITGKERGIVAAASYEAKACGVERGMRLFEVKRVCPDAVILPSDYETYSLFSVRMFDILCVLHLMLRNIQLMRPLRTSRACAVPSTAPMA